MSRIPATQKESRPQFPHPSHQGVFLGPAAAYEDPWVAHNAPLRPRCWQSSEEGEGRRGSRRISPVGCVCSPPLKGSIVGREEVEDGIGAPFPARAAKGPPSPTHSGEKLSSHSPSWGGGLLGTGQALEPCKETAWRMAWKARKGEEEQ